MKGTILKTIIITSAITAGMPCPLVAGILSILLLAESYAITYWYAGNY